MRYKIAWIGSVALGLETPGGRPIALSLEEGQEIPPEFKEGDWATLTNHADQFGQVGDENEGFYVVTHVTTGTRLRTWHRADAYKVE